MLEYSDHAKKRMQQRGISHKDVIIVLEHGELFYAPGGALGYEITKKRLQQIDDVKLMRDRRYGRMVERTANDKQNYMYRRLCSVAGVVVIVGEDGVVITVEHRTKRRKRA